MVGEDTFDQVSLKSGVSSSGHGQRRGTLKVSHFHRPERYLLKLKSTRHFFQFDDNDVIHQYDRKGKIEALHTSHMHQHAEGPSFGSPSSPMRPVYGSRSHSGSNIVPILEVPEGRELHTPYDGIDAREKRSDYGRDLTSSTSPVKGSTPLPTNENDVVNERFTLATPQFMVASGSSRGSLQTLLNRLTHSETPDLSLNPRKSLKERRLSDTMKRGGAHRGTKDYPHLPKNEADVERQERQGLVMASDEEDVTVHTDRSESDSPSPTEGKRPRRSSRNTNSISKMPRPLPYLPTSSPAGSENLYPPSK
jgi:hypothetical protein